MARAEDTQEFWPEVNLYKKLNPTMRLHFIGAYAKGKESEERTLDASGFIDITLKPVFRQSLQSEDWRKKKYLWTRLGYDHIFKAEGETKKAPEERLIAIVYQRIYLPAAVLVETRERVDFRWIDGDYSTRYRFRLEVNRDTEFGTRGRVATPYIQIEPFYDTRYDGWSRVLYQVGCETDTTKHLRLEPYIAWQFDTLPDDSKITAFGIVAKFYY